MRLPLTEIEAFPLTRFHIDLFTASDDPTSTSSEAGYSSVFSIILMVPLTFDRPISDFTSGKNERVCKSFLHANITNFVVGQPSQPDQASLLCPKTLSQDPHHLLSMTCRTGAQQSHQDLAWN